MDAVGHRVSYAGLSLVLNIFVGVEEYVEIEFMFKLVKLKHRNSCGIYRNHICKEKLFKQCVVRSIIIYRASVLRNPIVKTSQNIYIALKTVIFIEVWRNFYFPIPFTPTLYSPLSAP